MPNRLTFNLIRRHGLLLRRSKAFPFDANFWIREPEENKDNRRGGLRRVTVDPSFPTRDSRYRPKTLKFRRSGACKESDIRRLGVRTRGLAGFRSPNRIRAARQGSLLPSCRNLPCAYSPGLVNSRGSVGHEIRPDSHGTDDLDVHCGAREQFGHARCC